MEYLKVRKWEELQQYKDRDPKWIKLYRDLLDDYEFDSLDELAQLHLIKIWLLAAKVGNKIPKDPEWIGRKIGAQSKVQLDQICTAGFLSPYESVQPCTETYLEEETEEEKETEKKEREAASAPAGKKRKTTFPHESLQCRANPPRPKQAGSVRPAPRIPWAAPW